MATDDDRTVGMVDKVVRHRAQDGAPHLDKERIRLYLDRYYITNVNNSYYYIGVIAIVDIKYKK